MKKIDLTGQVFGRLKVLQRVESDSRGNAMYECMCSCGLNSVVIVSGYNLTSGRTKSCGCIQKERSSETNTADLTGKIFGHLKVLRRLGSNKFGQTQYECVCDCGNPNTVVVDGYSLVTGNTKSCGCLITQQLVKLHESQIKWRSEEERHLVAILNGMKQRCCNPNATAYKDYGLRGISVCSEWMKDPSAFITWAQNNGFKDGLEINRIDNDGPYSPENCEFVTRTAQMNNTRRNVFVTVNGVKHTIAEWSRITGIDYEKLRIILKKQGELEFISAINTVLTRNS